MASAMDTIKAMKSTGCQGNYIQGNPQAHPKAAPRMLTKVDLEKITFSDAALNMSAFFISELEELLVNKSKEVAGMFGQEEVDPSHVVEAIRRNFSANVSQLYPVDRVLEMVMIDQVTEGSDG